MFADFTEIEPDLNLFCYFYQSFIMENYWLMHLVTQF